MNSPIHFLKKCIGLSEKNLLWWGCQQQRGTVRWKQHSGKQTGGRYTRQVVKDALLELLVEHHFEDINITMLCR